MNSVMNSVIDNVSVALTDALGQLLADHCAPNTVRAIEAGASAQSLWQTIEAAGFADALVPEASGGAGLTLAEVLPMLALCGRFSLPVPLAETLFARALLAQAGVARPTGSITLTQGRPSADGAVVCQAVPYGRTADAVLMTVDGTCYLLSVHAAQSSESTFALDATLTWPADLIAPAQALPLSPDVRLIQACINAALLSGALQSVFERTLQYANERQQFGRPIGKFQAIQHQLSVMAEHAFAAHMAAQLAYRATHCLAPDRLQVAVAKARASEAALAVAEISHSIFGAIGFTQAFDLQLSTRRLYHWRQQGGAESHWHAEAGKLLVDQSLVNQSGLTLDLLRSATDV